MKTRAASKLCVILLFAAWCAAAPGDEDPNPGSPDQTEKENVSLEPSFRIPQEKGKGISHTPSIVFTKDGKRMLTATSDGQIVVFDVETRSVVGRLRLPKKGTDGVAIDSSGRYSVWSLGNDGVVVMEIASGKIVAQEPKLRVKWVAISPDDKRVGVTRDKTVEIRDLATLKLRGEAITADAEVTNVTWSPDGRLLGWTTAGGHVVVRDPKKGRNVYRTKKVAAQYAITFSPGNTCVAYGGADNKVYQYAFATEREEVISKGQPFRITCLGYSPDGTMIAVGDES
ncbi:MAG: WD40 repeat domain-containing protein, partial [Planctomycetota bacterium]